MTNADNPSHRHRLVDDEPQWSTSVAAQRFQHHDTKAIGHKQVYATVVQTANWSPDNSSFFGDVETKLLTSDSVIVRAALTCHGS